MIRMNWTLENMMSTHLCELPVSRAWNDSLKSESADNIKFDEVVPASNNNNTSFRTIDLFLEPLD